MINIVTAVGVLTLILIGLRSKPFLHALQLERYDSDRYRIWMEDNKEDIYSLESVSIDSKNDLKFTNRAKRLFITNLIINMSIIVFTIFNLVNIKHTQRFCIYAILNVIVFVFWFLLYLMQPAMMWISNVSISCLEDRINNKFYSDAKEKIANRKNLKVVGVTGSFGKTITKVTIGEILGGKYKVLNTPESYNTPMGLSKVINDSLTDEHDIFVAELGARKMGDLEIVSQLVQPDIAVITSIGPSHMETFKNIDNIIKTNYELIDNLSLDGVAILNYDNEHIKKLADKTFKEKILYGIENTEELDIYAEDLKVSEYGSEFTIKDKFGNETICKTKLVGRHNIHNILAGAATARALGISWDEIQENIYNIEPFPGTINISKSKNGYIEVDNTHNTNPIGAKMAIEVVSSFKEGKKVVVTPGFLGLGSITDTTNEELACTMGKVFDNIILIGKNRTEVIYEFLLSNSYCKENIVVVENLVEALKKLTEISNDGDVVLFENSPPID